MTKTRFLAFLTALALLLTIPTAVFAQSTIPHQFFGTATLDGATALDGTAITVWVDGSQVGATNIVNGSYSLQVGGEDGFAGKTVVFKVAAATAEQTLDWERGGVSELNLTASSSTNTTTPPVAGGEGEKGDKGDTGARGATGADGSDGSDGSGGAPGATGETGAAGSPGLPGVAGDDGGGGAIGIIALIVAIVALIAAGGAYMMGRRA